MRPTVGRADLDGTEGEIRAGRVGVRPGVMSVTNGSDHSLKAVGRTLSGNSQ